MFLLIPEYRKNPIENFLISNNFTRTKTKDLILWKHEMFVNNPFWRAPGDHGAGP
jgi:hypothetical protein